MRFSLWALPSLSQCSSSPPIHYISSGRSAWSNLDLIWCVCARVCVCEYDCENRRGERKKGEAKSQNLTQQSGSFGRYSFTLQYYCKTSWSFKSHKNITMALQICTSRSNSFSFWHTAALGLNARDVQRIPWLLKKITKICLYTNEQDKCMNEDYSERPQSTCWKTNGALLVMI